MPRFFEERPNPGRYLLTGENGRHAVKSLRLRIGEEVTVCDGKGLDYCGKVTEIFGDTAVLELSQPTEASSEPAVKIHLLQCTPKGDKLETVIQKSVELGVFDIQPVLSSRCIATIKDEKKLERLNKISLEAAKQSGRGIVPKVRPQISFEKAVSTAEGTKIIFYEGGGTTLKEILSGCSHEEITVLVGPEGGFSEHEVENAIAAGFTCATLGKRILRTETAPLCALSIIMYEVDR